MNFLEKILERKRAEVEERARRVPLEELRSRPDPRGAPRSLAASLRSPHGFALIAEIKKASPSAGLIRAHFDPGALAKAYARGGASALSVLTDEPFFQGRLEHLRLARDAARLPCLRKDFILSEYQVWEARAAGADAILLIIAALMRREMIRLLELAQNLDLETLVEVHDAREMDAALRLNAPIIGINNRNLRTFEVDLGATERLSEEVGPDHILVSESGIHTGADAARVRSWGADAILVGEALMRAPDKAAKMAELKGRPLPA
ncbi:MAG: indole-3-glycerol phosphate synthase TrpC [Verrucomicrobiae bacterium]|nr:indole-3-glycerol phosphate synthase TrpC [Verrucomicrobiae bacterium]